MTHDLLILIPALIMAGVFAGMVSGMLGVGGGAVTVPVLYALFIWQQYGVELSMHMAVATSLAIMIGTSLSSARSHWRRGSIDLELFKRWLPALALGAFIGSGLASVIDGKTLSLLFAILMLLVAAYFGLFKPTMRLALQLPHPHIQRLLAILFGTFSALVGVGGGTMMVPTFVLHNVELKRSIGTAGALGLGVALPGTIGFVLAAPPSTVPYALGYVSLIGMAVILPISMLTAPLGAKLAHHLDPQVLRRCFAAFVLFVSAKLFADYFGL